MSNVNNTNQNLEGINMEYNYNDYLKAYKRIEGIRDEYIYHDAASNQELYEYMYNLGKVIGPDVIWDDYSDIIIAFWGDFTYDDDNEIDYSPYAEFANFIGYNG
jgi:hypothetical protein